MRNSKAVGLRFQNVLARSTAKIEVLRNFEDAVKTSTTKEVGAQRNTTVTHNSVFAAHR
jgi:superfamily I DNA/RNA helicase